MRGTWLTRPTAPLVAMLLLLVWAGDGLGLHACGHHDGPAGAPTGPEAEHPAGHDHHRPGEPGPDTHGTHEGACTCAGACPTAAGTPLASGRATPLGAVEHPRPAPLPQVSGLLPSRHPPHFLPYALAPPARD
jgi:hypothetical protein